MLPSAPNAGSWQGSILRGSAGAARPTTVTSSLLRHGSPGSRPRSCGLHSTAPSAKASELADGRPCEGTRGPLLGAEARLFPNRFRLSSMVASLLSALLPQVAAGRPYTLPSAPSGAAPCAWRPDTAPGTACSPTGRPATRSAALGTRREGRSLRHPPGARAVLPRPCHPPRLLTWAPSLPGTSRWSLLRRPGQPSSA